MRELLIVKRGVEEGGGCIVAEREGKEEKGRMRAQRKRLAWKEKYRVLVRH